MGYLTTLGGEERTPEEIAAAGVPPDPNRVSDVGQATGIGFEQLGQIGAGALEYGLKKAEAHEAAARVRAAIRRSQHAAELRTQQMTPEGQAALGATFFDDGTGGPRVMDDPIRSLSLKAISSAPMMAAAVIPGVVLGPIGVAVAGGVLGIGETADAINTEMEGLTHEELYQGSKPYRMMIDSGMPSNEAREEIREMTLDLAAPAAGLITSAINRWGPEGLMAQLLAGKGLGGGMLRKGGQQFIVGGAEEAAEGAIPAFAGEMAGQMTGGRPFNWMDVAEGSAQEAAVGAPVSGVAGAIGGAFGPRVKPRVEKVPAKGPDQAMTQALGGAQAVPPAPPAAEAETIIPKTPQGPAVVRAPGTETPPPGGRRPKQNAKKTAAGGPTVSVQPVPVGGVDPALQAAIAAQAGAVRGEVQELLAKQEQERQQQAPTPVPEPELISNANVPVSIGGPETAPPPAGPEPVISQANVPVPPPAPPVISNANVPAPPPLPAQVTPTEPAVDQSGDAGEAGPSIGPGLAALAARNAQARAPQILPDVSARAAREAEIERASRMSTGEKRGTRYQLDETSAGDPQAFKAWRNRMLREASGEGAGPIATEVAGIRGARGTKLNVAQMKRLRELFGEWLSQQQTPSPLAAAPEMKAPAAPGGEAAGGGRVALAPGKVVKDLDKMTRDIARIAQETADKPTIRQRVNAMVAIMDGVTKRPDVQEKIANTPFLQIARKLKERLDNQSATVAEMKDFEQLEQEFIKPTKKELDAETVDIAMSGRGDVGKGETGRSTQEEQDLGEIETTVEEEAEAEAAQEGEQAGAAETEVTAGKKTAVPIGESDEAFDRKAEEYKSKGKKVEVSAEEKARYVTELNKKMAAEAAPKPKPVSREAAKAEVEEELPKKVTKKKEEKPGVKKVKAATKRLSETQQKQQLEEVTNEVGRALISMRQRANEDLAKNGPDSTLYKTLTNTIAKFQTTMVEKLGQAEADKINKMVDAVVNTPTSIGLPGVSSIDRVHTVSVEQFKQLLERKAIRPASLQDVEGIHHQRPLYKHPNTGQWYVAIEAAGRPGISPAQLRQAYKKKTSAFYPLGINPTVIAGAKVIKDPKYKLGGPVKIKSQGKMSTVHTTTVDEAFDHHFDIGDLADVAAEFMGKLSGQIVGKLNRMMVSRMRKLVGDTKVHVISDKQWKKIGMPENSLGVFWHERREIWIKQDTWESVSRNATHVFLHEVVHNAFVQVVETNPVFKEHLNRLRLTVAAKIGFGEDRLHMEYGLTNVHEFIAEAFSNPLFQGVLAEIKMNDQLAKELNMAAFAKSSVWGAFINLVRRALGLLPNQYSVLEGVVRAATSAASTHVLAKQNPFYKDVTTDQAGYLSAPIGLGVDLEARVSRIAPAGGLSKLLLKLRSLHQITQLADRYWPKGMALQVSNAMERARLMKQELVNKAQKFMLTEMHKLQNKEPEAFAKFQELAHAATAAGIHPDVALDDKKNKHITKSARYDFARKAHAKLHAEYNALPQEFKDVWQKTQKYFGDTQNEISLLSIENMVEQVLGRADKELARRMHEGEITEEDESGVFKTNKVLQQVNRASELKRLKGAYFPQMRRGKYVVMARYKLPTWVNFRAKTKEGKLTRATYEFSDKKDYDRFINDMHKRGLTVTSADTYSVDEQGKKTYTYVDPTTGDYTRDKKGNIRHHRYRKGDTDTHEVWRATVQDRLVEFHESEREAAEAKAQLKADKNYSDVALEERENLNFQKHTGATSLEIRRAVNSMQQTKFWENMSPQEQAASKQGMLELALNHLSATAPLNRARPRRNVMGASKDMVRNAAEYAVSTAGAIASLKNRPALDKAFAELKRYADEYRYESGNRELPRSQLLNAMYENAYAPELAPTKVNRTINALLAVSFIDKLVSPAFHMINAMQPWMVTLPVLSGRHGYAKSTYHLSKAYRDMGFAEILKSGVKDTAKAARDMLEGTTDYISDIGKRLSKQPDGSELSDMLVQLAQNGLIDKDAGMEVTELLDAPSKAEHILHRVDHVIRQFGTAGEVANRVSSAIAAYRLERLKGASIKDAQFYAQETVANTQGNYSVTNAPAMFRHPFGRLALQFKKYAQLQYYLMAKLAYNTFKGATPAEKLEAAKGLAGMLAMHVALAGALGLPSEPIKYPWMLLSFFLPMPGWDELEQMGTEYAQEFFGENMGDAIAHGLPRLAGIDLSSRVGLNTLLTHGEPRSDKENDVISWVAKTAIGAPGGLLVDWVKGAHDISQGNYKDALEKMVPAKVLSDAVRGYRRATEGTKSARGEQTSEGYGVMRGILQGVGFKPAVEAVRQEKTAAYFTHKGKREERRRELMDAFLSGEDRPAVRKAIIQYNSSVPPEARITMKALKSLAKRKKTERAKGYIQKGIYGGKINKDLLDKYIGQ